MCQNHESYWIVKKDLSVLKEANDLIFQQKKKRLIAQLHKRHNSKLSYCFATRFPFYGINPLHDHDDCHILTITRGLHRHSTPLNVLKSLLISCVFSHVYIEFLFQQNAFQRNFILNVKRWQMIECHVHVMTREMNEINFGKRLSFTWVTIQNVAIVECENQIKWPI